MQNNKILVLGSSGMLGHTLFYDLLVNRGFDVKGTVRSMSEVDAYFPAAMMQRVIPSVDAFRIDSIRAVIEDFRPQLVINCIGIIKQLPVSNDPLTVIALNAMFPHQLAAICKEMGCRLIHPSTDCVFDGAKGAYTEEDKMTADDLYGISKYMGEVKYEHTITLRTSIIGHELSTRLSLIEWFLSQNGKIKGFTKAIYTGFPTIEISRIIAEYIIPDKGMAGLYQVSSEPISKFDLLKLVAKVYEKEISIEPYDGYADNKALISERFRAKTGYTPPSWEELVIKMYRHYKQFNYKRNI